MADPGEAVYCTMLLSDNYLPGALVLAHSLRDNGCKAKLAVLVTLDSLKASTIDELKTIYDDVVPINRIVNHCPANLYLMDRPDLASTFSKIELWRQTQYRQIVYIDADVVSLRAPNELLTINTNFAAVPDTGWPDCFNTGLMVLRPSMHDYYSLLALAQQGVSFDGADQGLLNIHFKKWDRLSFVYNCTPSGHYQYVPAFRHFGSTISLVHYIGSQKPWNLPRQLFPSESPYNQLLGRWWATYFRHYRPVVKPESKLSSRADIAKHGLGQLHAEGIVHEPTKPPERTHAPEIPHAQAYTYDHPHACAHFAASPTMSPAPASAPLTAEAKAFVEPQAYGNIQQFNIPHGFPPSQVPETSHSVHNDTILNSDEVAATPASPPQRDRIPIISQNFVVSAVPQYVRGEEHVTAYRHFPRRPFDSPSTLKEESVPGTSPVTGVPTLPTQQQFPQELTEPLKQLEIGQIPVLFQEPEPPRAAPEPSFSSPRMQWDPSREPPPVDSKPEAFSLPSHTYTMSQDTGLFQPPKSYPEAPKDMYYKVPPKQPNTQRLAHIFPWEAYAPKPTRVFLDEEAGTGIVAVSHEKLLSEVPNKRDTALGAPREESAEPPPTSEHLWKGYIRSNAWDEVPEIEQYMRTVQKPRREKVQVLKSGLARSSTTRGDFETEITGRKPSVRLTSFPTETERPSFPVTPATIKRSHWPIGQQREEKSKYGREKSQGGYGGDNLPPATGVPLQENWNPLERLEELQRRQSLFLDVIHDGPPEFEVREIPRRRMPGE
ncbi:hypothetical protein PAAG_11367 [Paracoccidioides lutzii Pb01]|uniref:glycogenin glucosyltransferase n=1 Tax=Paracoccidioides lutzii (strain ATCC MYA-826 / Pb01) TaxID=502779 RepID=A0A0A2V1Y8_PARBA|nr:hypothetical protein PAAG_11367 [Paracoccidioides lutzii Pb01]KGQ01796.1 hypothetical protein PAAG_11367 [Paracoccidioides lutzii Pb01]